MPCGLVYFWRAGPGQFSLALKVEGRELLAHAAAGVVVAVPEAASHRVLEEDDLSALFGLDLASPHAPDQQRSKKAQPTVPCTAEAPKVAKTKQGLADPAGTKPAKAKAKPKKKTVMRAQRGVIS